MDRAGDHELRCRHVDGEKDAAFRGLCHAAFSRAQMLGKRSAQRILADLGGFDEALPTVLDIGYDDRSAPRGAFGIECGENVESHDLSVVIPETERSEVVRNP